MNCPHCHAPRDSPRASCVVRYVCGYAGGERTLACRILEVTMRFKPRRRRKVDAR